MMYRFLFSSLCLGTLFSQDVPYAGAVGSGLTSPFSGYVALIRADSTLSEIPSPFPSTTFAFRAISINRSGTAIVGADSVVSGYMAYISPTGELTTVTGDLPAAGGFVINASINDSSQAIAGGTSSNQPYIALISPSGVATSVTGGDLSGNGVAQSVAINNAGVALAGGRDGGNTSPYILQISSSGVATKLSGSDAPIANGIIQSVDINESSFGIAAGDEDGGITPYAAFISPSGTITRISGAGAPQNVGTGRMFASAINESGDAIIGGLLASPTRYYAALVSASGQVTQVSGSDLPLPTSSITTVDINNSGAGVIGGTEDGSAKPYVALVAPTGVITKVFGPGAPSGDGAIRSVAIDQTGVVLVGGEDRRVSGSNFASYLALVSPSGIATRLTPSTPTGGTSRVFRVAFSGVFGAVVPTSFGAGNSAFGSSLFALSSQALPSHFGPSTALLFRSSLKSQAGPIASADKMEDSLCIDERDLSSSKQEEVLFENPDSKCSLWASGFGNYARLQNQESSPGAKAASGGVLAALDWRFKKHSLLGIGAAYAYSRINLLNHLGIAKVNQELLTAYYSFTRKYFALDLALWGGIYQTKNVRNSGFGIASKANIHGWVLLPHLEMSSPIPIRQGKLLFDPFVMFDYLNNWQNHFQETGASGFNLIMGDQYSSLLRSELGLRFFQICEKDWGSVILNEKLSYVNQHPLQGSSAQVAFVGSVSSFTLQFSSPDNQNLGAFQFGVSFVSNKPKSVSCSFNYQIEAGPYLVNQFGNLEIGKKF